MGSKPIFLYKVLVLGMLIIASALILAEDALGEILTVDVRDCLRVRTGPGTEYISRWSLAPGARIAVVARDSDWVLAAWANHPDEPFGWVCGDYLR